MKNDKEIIFDSSLSIASKEPLSFNIREKFHLVLLLKYSCLFYFLLRRLHVWGHFCLCYNDQKLVTETEYIKNYGIKDGDQVCSGFFLVVLKIWFLPGCRSPFRFRVLRIVCCQELYGAHQKSLWHLYGCVFVNLPFRVEAAQLTIQFLSFQISHSKQRGSTIETPVPFTVDMCV